ncbi:MAG: hypothetical protein HC836_26270 [Richelia sp. RM2_1_2]|nr:hypothetical protein [Richelia sp. RM2_1_2]
MKAIELLFELDDNDIGYYSPEEDDLSRLSLTNTRKPKFTLRHLNRLKKIRATRAAENLMKQDLLNVMYAVPDEGAEGGGL